MAEEKVEELVPVGPGADEEDVRDSGAEREEADDDSDEGESSARSGDDERVAHTDDADDDRTAIRERRRAEKQRKRENRDRDRLELGFLRQRNEALERRQSEQDARISQGELITIDNKIAELDGQIREAKRIEALAIDKHDGTSATEAGTIARDLAAGRDQLARIKDQRVRAASAPQRPQVDPAIIENAKTWAEAKPWYDPNLRNADSRVAKAVEDDLFREGNYDARTPAYWKELDKRLKKYLPDRFDSRAGNGRDDHDEDDDDGEEEVRKEPKSRGPRITTGGRERPLRKNEVYISAERKAAMVEAGVWDDPTLRDKYLKQYQKFDREQRRH